MGFFDKLKASVGIGQPKMAMTVDNTQVQRGGTIKGKLTLTAKEREVPVKCFIIELSEIRTLREWNGNKKEYENKKVFHTIGKKEMPEGDFLLKANENVSRDFDIQVPSSAMSTGQSIAYTLKVSADIPGLDASEKAEIFVI